MQPNDTIGPCLDYIEANLKTTITAGELADMAGYSLWHYCRIFSQVTGMPVAGYICKRRLDKILAEISAGRKPIDVVPEYGFDTYAGFYKAFVRMYGCSPKKYLSLYGKHQSNRLGDFFMVTEQELRLALAHWALPQNLPLRDVYIMDGVKISGNVWTLGDGYILKTGERSRLLRDLRLQKALASQGFTAALPVAAKSGHEYLDGERFFILMNKLPGAPLDKSDRFGESRREIGVKYGQSIAKLHCALAEVENSVMPDEADLYKQVTDWAIPNIKKQNVQWDMGLPDSFFEDYIENFGKMFDKLPKQLIHRDPNPSNILFSGGEVSGFIDFDLNERNIRLWDPCYCATGILSEWRGVDGIHEKWPDILEGVLQGYNNINALTQEEKQAIFYVLCSIQMICAAYFEGIEEYKELAKTNREMLCFIVKSKERITGIF